MSDDSGFDPEGPLIDARSPAERWAESGRAGIERMRDAIDRGGLDQAALWWMVLLLAYTALQIDSALRPDSSGGTDWWTKAELLTTTGGIVLIFGSLAGVLVASFFESRGARAALRLATLAGAWIVVAGLIGVVVSFHDAGSTPVVSLRGAEGKVLLVLFFLCYAGFGVVIAVLARRLTGARAADSFDRGRACTS